MGNYHSYDLKSEHDLLLEVPKVYFEERDRVENLMLYGYTQSKRWYMEKDISEFSKHYPDEIFIIFETHEDGDEVWQHQFKNGVRKTVLGELVFPEIKWDI